MSQVYFKSQAVLKDQCSDFWQIGLNPWQVGQKQHHREKSYWHNVHDLTTKQQ